MLALKFSVPLTSRLLNFRTLAKATCPREKTCNPQDSFRARSAKRSRCLDYEKSLEKCPKDNLANRCRKKMFPDNTPQPKCNWSSADDYRRAYEAIKTRSRKLIDLVEANSTLIIQEMRNEIAKSRCFENSHIKRILKQLEPPVIELMNLDPVCAMKKKREVLTSNDRTRQELLNRDCETQIGLRLIECDLEKLTCLFKSKVDACLTLLSSCRKSQSPKSLIDCVEHSSREAAKILDNVSNDFEIQITSIKKAMTETLKEDKAIFEGLTEKYEKNMSRLLSEILDCVHERKP